MNDILCVSTPLQVVLVAVQFVSVLVIDFGEIFRIGDECLGNEFVYAPYVFAEMD